MQRTTARDTGHQTLREQTVTDSTDEETTRNRKRRQTTKHIKRTNATQQEEAIAAEEKEQIESLRDYWLEPGGDRYCRHAQMDANIEGQQDMGQGEES